MSSGYSEYCTDMKVLSEALALAVANSFMSREHAKAVWMQYIKNTPMDVKKETPKVVEEK